MSAFIPATLWSCEVQPARESRPQQPFLCALAGETDLTGHASSLGLGSKKLSEMGEKSDNLHPQEKGITRETPLMGHRTVYLSRAKLWEHEEPDFASLRNPCTLTSLGTKRPYPARQSDSLGSGVASGGSRHSVIRG